MARPLPPPPPPVAASPLPALAAALLGLLVAFLFLGASRKKQLWARYKALLVERPLLVNILQTGFSSASANVVAQLLSGREVQRSPVIEQAILSMCFIAPIVSTWLRILPRFGLHWIASALLDQFMFAPTVTIGVFYFISAFFKSGVSIVYDPDAPLTYSFILNKHVFPSLIDYQPVWSTQLKAYAIWLPATFIREALIPRQFAPLFINCVSFIWSVAFALILLAS
ncbi:MAG: hypothetical protein SGPRY_003769 [Prymnesium sp.]